MGYTIEPGAESNLGPCECCGGTTRIVRGFVSDAQGARAAYLVRWTVGRPEHDASVAVSIGPWGHAPSSDRSCFVLALRTHPSPAFMIVDAGESGWTADAGVLGRMLSRAEGLASPWKQEVFDVLDAAGEADGRLEGWWLGGGEST